MASKKPVKSYKKGSQIPGIKAFFALNPGPVCRLDKNGKIVQANPSAVKAFGREKLIGVSWLKLCPGMDHELWDKILHFPETFHFETKIGKINFLFDYVNAGTNKLVFGTDISSQKKIEKKIEEQANLLKDMARFPEMNPGPVLRMDQASKILLSNSVAVALFGTTLLNKEWKDVCPGLTDEVWNQILAADAVIPLEAYVGKKCFVFNHRRDKATKLVFVYGTDITINKLNEKKLEDQRAIMKEIARFPDMNPGPVLRMDLKGFIKLSNIAAQNLFEKNITEDCWLDICPGMNDKVWSQILSTEKVFPLETRISEKDFVFHHRMDPQTNLVFVYGTDVTLQKLAEKQLRHSEKMASLGEITAGIAHEIQNPLNFVNNFSELNKELLGEMNDEITKENFDEVKTIAKNITDNEEKINYHGKRAEAIVKSMLQHSRSSSNKKEMTDINELSDEYLRLAYHGLRAKDKSFHAKFETQFDPGISKIAVVPQEIGRVLLNLINNAFYAVSEKKKISQSAMSGGQYEPTVTISTKKENGKVGIRICDNGIGIPLKALDKIFQPFFTTKPTGQGTGLGLSLSYDIIKAHGGELKVETKEGEGSTFIILLPLQQ